MPTRSEILKTLSALAPLEYACDWDHVGLQVGEAEKEVKKILLSLDPSLEAAEEAGQKGCDLILTHHPLFFKPITALTGRNEVEKTALLLARKNIGLLSMHTNLDAAHGGVSDALAAAVGIYDIEEIPNFDARPDIPHIGRMGRIPSTEPMAFLKRVIALLNAPGARYILSDRPVSRLAVVGGSGGDYIADAHQAGCDSLLTADLSYHELLLGREYHMNLFDLGHFETERVILPVLKDFLEKTYPSVELSVSEIPSPIGMVGGQR